jgi:hypothetical protein
MPQFYRMLTPISDEETTAYYLDDVLKHMGPAHKKKLNAWLNGRVTLTLIDNREVIFKHDLDKFFDTL